MKSREPDAPPDTRSQQTLPVVDRRTTLAWIAAAGAFGGLHIQARESGASSGPINAQPGRLIRYSPTAGGYGTDPNLLQPRVTWDRTLTDCQRRQLAGLADLILPAEADAPAPSSIGIADFLAEWLSAPYPTQLADRALVLPGLVALGTTAHRAHGLGWLDSTVDQQLAILSSVARDEARLSSAAEPGSDRPQFLLRMRSLVLGGYYTTPRGWKDIGYIGNVTLTAFPEVSIEVRAVLEQRLRALKV